MEYDAILTDYKVVKMNKKFVLIGTIEADVGGRWFDGTEIRTSYIPDFDESMIGDGLIVQTCNTKYLLKGENTWKE